MSSRPVERVPDPRSRAAATGVPGLAEALLGATSMVEVAPVLVAYAVCEFDADEATLLWWLDGPHGREQLPVRPLGDAEERLMEQALLEDTEAPVRCDETGACVLALRDPESTSWAALVWRERRRDREERAADGGWAFAAAARARVRQIMEHERLRIAVRRLQKAESLQRALFGIADMASSDLDMPDMLQGLHDIVGSLMYAANLYIVQFDPVADTVRFIYFVDSTDPEPPDPDTTYRMDEIQYSPTWHLIRHGKPLMGTTEDLLRQIDGPLRGSGPRAMDWLGVPMLSGSEVRGAIVVQSYESICYTAEDNTLLQFVARHIQTALERKQAQEELERRVEQRTRELGEANRVLRAEVHERQRGERLQAALFRIAELASTADSMETFYREVHAIVGGLLYAENFFIALLSDDGSELHFPYAVDARDARSQFKPRKLATGLTEYVLRRGAALLADRAEIERLTEAGEVQSFGARSVCWLGVPLICDEAVVGVLVVQSYSPEHLFTPRDLELLTFVSYQIANGLQRKRAQDSLRTAYADLERRVDERTRELAETNRELLDQIGVREHMERKLKHEALHDALTGLPNRSFLLDRLGRALSRYQRDEAHQFAVLFLDLDRFKVVNDSVGHLVGDEMLKEAGARLSGCVRDPDVVSRLGGDEFAILLEDIDEPEEATRIAERVIHALGEPMRVGGKELFTSASIGIALSHARYRSAEELLRDADVAMYRAKARGRQRYELFDERLHEEALHLLDLEGDLRRAVLRREFEPHYQGIVRLRDAAVVGYEALLRWRHPERGLLLPADFLAVAEDSGSAEAIDWQIFERSCAEARRLVEGGAYVSLNVSARHFRSGEFAARVLGLAEQCELPAGALRLEVTEGALLDNPDEIRATLEQLRRAGVMTALDDFGTGYSSLSYLHRFPLQALKIDRSFVADLRPGLAGGSAAVVRAIRALAGSLGMEVIAEGIETSEQRDALLELGCELGQGFLFAHPRPLGKVMGMRTETN